MTFDGPTKVITLTVGTVAVSVRDLWSRWVDWFLTGDNSKYLPAFMQVGGDDIDLAAGTKIPIYAFLMNGWRIKPQEANHTLTIGDGILLVNGGGDPFNNTDGAYVVRINYQQPVQAISFSSEGGSGGLTPSEHDELFAIRGADGDTLKDLSDQADALGLDLDTMLAYVRNKKRLEKVGSTWYLVIRDAGDNVDILRKPLKDKNGNEITDIVAGVMASEGASSV